MTERDMSIGKTPSFTLVTITGPTVCAFKFLLTISSGPVPAVTLVCSYTLRLLP